MTTEIHQNHQKRRIAMLLIAAALIIYIGIQLSYHIPKIQQASDDLKIANENVRLAQEEYDKATARVDALNNN
jgi:hypothetical protein